MESGERHQGGEELDLFKLIDEVKGDMLSQQWRKPRINRIEWMKKWGKRSRSETAVGRRFDGCRAGCMDNK